MSSGKWLMIRCFLVASLSLSACSTATQTPERTPTLPPTHTATQSPTSTVTPTPSPSPTVTFTPTPTLTPTPLLLALQGTDLPDESAPLWFGNAAQVSALAEFNQDSVVDLAWTLDGNSLAVASPENITLYDVKAREVINILPAESTLASISFSPDSSWLAASYYVKEETGFTGGFQLWRTTEYTGIGTFFLDDRAAGDLIFSQNGRQLVVVFTGQADEDNYVRVWNTTTWEITRTLRTGPVQSIAYSPNGSLLATSPDRYAVKIWQTRDGSELQTIYTSFTGAVNCLAFSPDGTRLATGHYDGLIQLWDTYTATLLNSFETGSVVDSLTFNPDGTLLASGGGFQDNNLRLWDVETGLLLRLLEGHTHSIDSLAFSPNGQILASGSYDGTLRLWGIRPY